MSNRDPHYTRNPQDTSSKTSGNDKPFGSSGEFDTGSNKAKDRMYDGMNKANDAANQAQDKLYDGLNKAEDMANKAESKMDLGKHKAEEVAGMARDRADEGCSRRRHGWRSEAIRQRGEEQGGTVGSVAGTAADAMETAGSYLHDSSTSDMMDQLEAYIRKNPTQSLLIAAGVGFVLAKAMK